MTHRFSVCVCVCVLVDVARLLLASARLPLDQTRLLWGWMMAAMFGIYFQQTVKGRKEGKRSEHTDPNEPKHHPVMQDWALRLRILTPHSQRLIKSSKEHISLSLQLNRVYFHADSKALWHFFSPDQTNPEGGRGCICTLIACSAAWTSGFYSHQTLFVDAAIPRTERIYTEEKNSRWDRGASSWWFAAAQSVIHGRHI